MKHNQKKRQGNQPRQNHSYQHKPMTAVMTIEKVREITISRDEYDELMYCAVLLDVLERLHKIGGMYAVTDLLGNIFSEAEKIEKEDK